MLTNNIATSISIAPENGVVPKSSLLSIFVPTINRAEDLVHCLKSILPEAKAHGVSIIVSDNCSEDSTCEVVESFKKDYSHLHYHRQKTRITMDANQNYYHKLVTTKYCLMIADDDGLEVNVLSKIIEMLTIYEPDLMLLNAYHYDQSLNDRVYKNMLLESDLIVRDPVMLMTEYIFKMHYSTLVINIESIKGGAAAVEKYEGTYHAYIGIQFDYLAHLIYNRGSILGIIVALPVIKIRDGTKTYSAEKVGVLLDRFPMFFDRLPVLFYTAAQRKKEELLEKHLSIKNLLVYNFEGALDLDLVDLSGYRIGNYNKFKIKVVSLVPKIVISLMITLSRLIKGSTRAEK